LVLKSISKIVGEEKLIKLIEDNVSNSAYDMLDDVSKIEVLINGLGLSVSKSGISIKELWEFLQISKTDPQLKAIKEQINNLLETCK